MTPATERADITDPADNQDITAKADRAEPTANTDPKDPMEPMEQAEPTLPMDSTEFRDPMDNTEPEDHSDNTDRSMTAPSVPVAPAGDAPTLACTVPPVADTHQQGEINVKKTLTHGPCQDLIDA